MNESATGPIEAAEAEDRLRKLLSSIGQLSEHGEVPAYAFATLISSAPPQAIAEHLHQRWLSDSHFAQITPKIILHMSTNVKVYSQVLALVLRDYNLRDEIRTQSRGMFRNYVRTLVELYPVYRQIDKSLSACLVDPLFHCLQMLSEEVPDDNDLLCFAILFAEFGQRLHQLNPSECDRMVFACRFWLCSDQLLLEQKTRGHLMKAIDLWTYSWDPKLFPDCLRRHYADTEAIDETRKILCRQTAAGVHCSSSSSAVRPPWANANSVSTLRESANCPSLPTGASGTMPTTADIHQQQKHILREANRAQSTSPIPQNGNERDREKESII